MDYSPWYDRPTCASVIVPRGSVALNLMAATSDFRHDRAFGALRGLALGDALGMPTQSFTREQIVSRYGELLPGLISADDDHPYAPGLSAGTVTDDTEQSVLVAHLLIEGSGRVTPESMATMLTSWEKSVVARGLRDLLGPSTSAALAEWRAGVSPSETGRRGVTNGAAMRITPVGIATSPDENLLVERVVMVSSLTHRTDVALGAAGFVAGCASALIEGCTWVDAASFALGVASKCVMRGVPTDDGEVESRLREALASPPLPVNGKTADLLASRFGVDVRAVASVPTAVAVTTACGGDPWGALRLSASLGDDTDTMASIAGALLGARWGSHAFPDADTSLVERHNTLDLGTLASQLLELRR